MSCLSRNLGDAVRHAVPLCSALWFFNGKEETNV
jgi:hypothetical protein